MKKIYFFAASMALPFMADAQSAIDGFRFSQPDMKGTARYMGMGGAFGALGGDLSSISTNPAGIGVYRRNEIGITMDVDMQSATSEAQGIKNTQNQTKVLLNNVGGIASWNLMNSTMPTLNLGFTYNRGASFNAHYAGVIPNLSNSLTNYIAGVSNNAGVTENSVETLWDQKDNIIFDPYNPSGNYSAPWISILGYDSYLITPTGDPDQPHWIGQWGADTSGSGAFDVVTSGGVNEYNIAIGGNIANKVFWGVDFGIVDLDYNMTARWAEDLHDANVYKYSDEPPYTHSNFMLTNDYRVNANGVNVKAGVIYRPIQELRLGLSFASPTWYSVNESYFAGTRFDYSMEGNTDPNQPTMSGDAVTNLGDWGTNSYNFRTPWKLTASAAGVIGRSLILSADFEWQKYNKMRFSDRSNNYYGFGGGFDDYWPYNAPAQKAGPLINTDNWYETNADIEDYYKSTYSIRLGAEYRITPRFSVRAGYAHVTSPVREEAKDGSMMIITSGTMPNYRMDNSTNYITCGLGYNFNHFYVDAAFVHKNMNSEYHAYTPDPANPQIPSPTSKLSLNNNQIVLSAGVRF